MHLCVDTSQRNKHLLRITTATLPQLRTRRDTPILPIAIGTLVTLAVSGYQFGSSNHTVYLLAALHRVHPELLARDWFTTQTCQYHVVFTLLSALLMRLHCIEAFFFCGYLALAIVMNLAWWRIVRSVDGNARTFYLSVFFFYISAGGTGLGFYQFLQDSCFLPSNISAVAMLWAIAAILRNEKISTAIALAIAGIFHTNFALIAPLLWLIAFPTSPAGLLIFAASAINLALIPWPHGQSMPLQEFVDLYVKLRHPHHYDPSSWPWWLWLSFLWPIPFFFVRAPCYPQIGVRIFLFFCTLTLIALIFAGLFYVSEHFIQTSLFRFSIYIKLLACISVARTTSPRKFSFALALSIIPIGLYIQSLGLIPHDDADYLQLCTWVSHNTPTNSLFLVPPDEQSMRLVGQRAIVTNFKGIPQLSPEIIDWRQRMELVLGTNLNVLSRGFAPALRNCGTIYDARVEAGVVNTAKMFDADYIVIRHELREWPLVYRSGKYFLYHRPLQP